MAAALWPCRLWQLQNWRDDNTGLRYTIRSVRYYRGPYPAALARIARTSCSKHRMQSFICYCVCPRKSSLRSYWTS
jgi:hypothetical protein